MHDPRLRPALSALVAVGLCAGLLACGQPEPGDFRPLAKDEVDAELAVIYLYRPPSVLGVDARCNTQLGEELVGGLGPGDYTWRALPAGKTRIESSPGAGSFVTVRLRPGQQAVIRQSWRLRGSGFEPLLEHLPRARALPELAGCSFVEMPEEVEPPPEEATGDDPAASEGDVQ